MPVVAVQLVHDGLLPRSAVRRAGVDPSTLYAWLHQDAPELVRASARRCWRCYPDVPLDGAAYAHLLGALPWERRPDGALRVSVNRRVAVAALDEHVGPKS